MHPERDCLMQIERLLDLLPFKFSFRHVKSHQEASEILKEIAEPQDVVLIKGSRGMKMENVIQNLYKV